MKTDGFMIVVSEDLCNEGCGMIKTIVHFGTDELTSCTIRSQLAGQLLTAQDIIKEVARPTASFCQRQIQCEPPFATRPVGLMRKRLTTSCGTRALGNQLPLDHRARYASEKAIAKVMRLVRTLWIASSIHSHSRRLFSSW